MIYKIINGSAPSYLCNLFKKRSDVHNRYARNCKDLNIPKCRTSLAQRSFRYRATKIWNNIPDEIRNSKTITIFKKKVKNWLHTKS